MVSPRDACCPVSGSRTLAIAWPECPPPSLYNVARPSSGAVLGELPVASTTCRIPSLLFPQRMEVETEALGSSTLACWWQGEGRKGPDRVHAPVPGTHGRPLSWAANVGPQGRAGQTAQTALALQCSHAGRGGEGTRAHSLRDSGPCGLEDPNPGIRPQGTRSPLGASGQSPSNLDFSPARPL